MLESSFDATVLITLKLLLIPTWYNVVYLRAGQPNGQEVELPP